MPVAEIAIPEYHGTTMSTQILIKKLYREMGELKDDVRTMKRFLWSPLRDTEGEYRDSFVKKMLARSQSRGPLYRFTDRASFLMHVRAKV